jgi:hypothetical protein
MTTTTISCRLINFVHVFYTAYIQTIFMHPCPCKLQKQSPSSDLPILERQRHRRHPHIYIYMSKIEFPIGRGLPHITENPNFSRYPIILRSNKLIDAWLLVIYIVCQGKIISSCSDWRKLPIISMFWWRKSILIPN